ncbi:hypothetical protein AB1Y20_007203 [Prymnesium parvum]|uniref:Major facilitator superfamily (MFS) profile domain-containing protein n=1 Tax=Prymnesium parvum TaxID=97485 RepID=A0AB34IVE9_PRYPA
MAALLLALLPLLASANEADPRPPRRPLAEATPSSTTPTCSAAATLLPSRRTARRSPGPPLRSLRPADPALLANSADPRTPPPAERALDERRLLRGRAAVLICLFAFTFFNGVARRSLSSAAPSLVAEGLLTEARAEFVFTQGFDAFAVGKLLVIPTLMFLGAKAALLVQAAAVTGCCAALCMAAGSARVQSGAWVGLRVFSAMATSTILPFVGAWFPRGAYGRVFAWLFSGFQAGYLFVSVYWQRVLFSERGLHWREPFATCTAFGVLLLLACAALLHERPPSAASPPAAAAPSRAPPLLKLVEKIRTRWVFWAMVVTVFAYTPIVEYSTHVTSYLKEMASEDKPTRNGFVCLASNLCEARYRKYVLSYVSSLAVGSVFYDRATQLDRALLVLGLYLINICCWVLLALSEPSQVPSLVAATPTLLSRLTSRFSAAAAPSAAGAVYLPLASSTKTMLASIAGATIALPSSLPFAIFALDFGKEGAAVLGALLSAVAMVAAVVFLRAFPLVRRTHGWLGIHASLAACGVAAASSMGAIMLHDYRKFSRGYIIESSLANETVVTLHACPRPSCAAVPMWRPGARRVWAGGATLTFRAHVPTRFCHHCGRGELVECKVEHSASEAALFTPYEQCAPWIREVAPLRKPKGGWAFSDPLRFPLAPEATYGDRRAYVRRLERGEDEEPTPAER